MQNMPSPWGGPPCPSLLPHGDPQSVCHSSLLCCLTGQSSDTQRGVGRVGDVRKDATRAPERKLSPMSPRKEKGAAKWLSVDSVGDQINNQEIH